MNRWTTTGFPECECGRCSAECDDPMMGVCWVRGAVNRLAAYEDTGMTPDEIVVMREELEFAKTALDDMRFAYVNKDEDFPHQYEKIALMEVEKIIGKFGERHEKMNQTNIS